MSPGRSGAALEDFVGMMRNENFDINLASNWDKNLPESIHGSPSSSEVEYDEEDKYLMEMEGPELQKSLQMQMETEVAILGQDQARDEDSNGELTGYQTLLAGVSEEQWRKAEANRSLGYTGNLDRSQQRH